MNHLPVTMRKVLLITGIVIVVLVAAVWITLDLTISAAVEKGGTYALGVKTELGSANASLLGGKLTLKELEIANAPGFEAPFFLRVDRTSVAVSPMSLTSDTVEVPSFELADLEVYLERTTKGTNYDAILDSLKRFESGDKKPSPEDKGGGKKFIVRDVMLRNVKVHANVAPGVLGKSGQFEVTIPEIHLTNVGTGEGGRSIASLMAELVKTVLAAAVKSGAGVFPDGMLDDLGKSISTLGDQAFKTVGSGLQKIGEGAGKAIDNIGKDLNKIFK